MGAFVVPPDNSADDDDDPSQERPHVMDVEGRLTALEVAIADLKTEVVTGRLVVQDEGGQPRIVGEVVDGVTELRLDLPGKYSGERTGLLLLATDGRNATDFKAVIGVELWVEGDQVASFGVWRGSDGVWISDLQSAES